MDVDSIGLGLDFEESIRRAVESCVVMLVLIGPEWSAETDARGGRRLENPRDYVRIEVEQALDRDIRVIPVLLQGAGLPDEDDLPDCLKPLIRRQAFRLSDDTFRSDCRTLVEAIERIVSGAPPPSPEVVRAPPPAPAEPRARSDWVAELLGPRDTRARRLRVTLTKETHVLEGRVPRIANAFLEVNGAKVAKLSAADEFRIGAAAATDDKERELREFAFSLPDGDRQVAGQLRLTSVKGVIVATDLTLDDRLVFHEGADF